MGRRRESGTQWTVLVGKGHLRLFGVLFIDLYGGLMSMAMGLFGCLGLYGLFVILLDHIDRLDLTIVVGGAGSLLLVYLGFRGAVRTAADWLNPPQTYTGAVVALEGRLVYGRNRSYRVPFLVGTGDVAFRISDAVSKQLTVGQRVRVVYAPLSFDVRRLEAATSR